MRRFPALFPLLYPISYVYLLFAPWAAIDYAGLHKENEEIIRKRMEEKNHDKPLDYVTQYLNKQSTNPPLGFLVSQAIHLAFDHFESASVLSAGIYFLTTSPEVLSKLQKELRESFTSHEDMTDRVLERLPWLKAVIEEILRIHTNVPYGLPRISPGHDVDGNYVAKGVS
jgi:cytochrome P450